jgi:hypothetical protein
MGTGGSQTRASGHHRQGDCRAWRGWVFSDLSLVRASYMIAHVLPGPPPDVVGDGREPAWDCAITTVRRPGNYLHTLLDCLPPELAVRLVVGEPDDTFLPAHPAIHRVQILVPRHEEWSPFQQRPVAQRAAWNYWRALTVGASGDGTRGLLVLEDDVTLAAGWVDRLRLTIRQLRAQHGDRWILALYTSVLPMPPPHPGRPRVLPYPPQMFYGTQAIYYPPGMRTELADHLRRMTVESFQVPYDIAIALHLRQMEIPLFATVPCLAQHIGEVSTGLATFFHRASRYEPGPGEPQPST